MAENMSLTDQAMQALTTAFRNSIDVAWMAKDLQETARKLEASAKPHNAELWGEEPIGGASRTNAMLGAAVPPAQAFSKD